MKRVKTDQSRYSFALITSLVLHVCFLVYFLNKNLGDGTVAHSGAMFQKKSPTIQLDSIKIINQKQLQVIKDAQRKQIVANELNGKKERPQNSRFAGEADQTFDRQTMAARNGAFKAAGLGSKSGEQEIKSTAVADAISLKKMTHEKKVKSVTSKGMTLSDLGTIQMAQIETQENEKAQLDSLKKTTQESRNTNAQGTERGSANSTGLAQNNDFVEDVPLGDMTNLNTTEFKYYGFYHRIRQKLEQHWGSSIQAKAKNLYKSGRRLPASDNLITAVQVVLDDRGHIVEIKIEGTSGIRELDQAAIESFNKAGPFPNPPKGLLVDGRAVIQWGFVVKS
jgi:protein TonB